MGQTTLRPDTTYRNLLELCLMLTETVIAPEVKNSAAWRQEDEIERVQNEAFV